jgi:hypothetical protein
MEAAMASIAIASPVPASRPMAASAVLGVAGLVLVALGAFLPWLSIYAGLMPIPGYQLDGGALAGVAVGAAGLLLAASRLGGARLRPVAALMALAVAADAIYTAWRISAFVAHPGPAGALTQPASGPGALVMAIGGLLLAGAAITLRAEARPLSRAGVGRVALAAALLLAAWIHLLLVPEHLAESTALGAGFLAAGVAQASLAAVVLLRRSEVTLFAAVAVSAALLALYAWAVVVGLPIGGAAGEAHEAAAGLRLFAGEPIDLAGAANALAELTALVLAVVMLGGTRPVDLGDASA